MIFLSANAEVEDKPRGIELGAVGYITKPFHMAEVKAQEYADDQGAASVIKAAGERGWCTVSMQKDFKKIFPFAN